ncbi:AAA+ ATPase domain-containing protein [Artemisia annua]|uniref:AAA+ ATPase domain-containing protein n=1 Tax=Artemisia annua TaxID=35608 RepID=A0A2U1L5V3_ARTAN|nr:AAA+ ATPase domain-containing protein [Artemisia annua]
MVKIRTFQALAGRRRFSMYQDHWALNSKLLAASVTIHLRRFTVRIRMIEMISKVIATLEVRHWLVGEDLACTKIIGRSIPNYLQQVLPSILDDALSSINDALVFLNKSQDTKISALVDKNKKMSKAETKAGDEGPPVTEDDIQHIVSSWTGIPVEKVSTERKYLNQTKSSLSWMCGILNGELHNFIKEDCVGVGGFIRRIDPFNT